MNDYDSADAAMTTHIRKHYSRPQLTTLGDVRELTRTANTGSTKDLHQAGPNTRT
jgi:hypothetical protein